MVVGDLIEVVDSQTSGIDNGSVGLVTKIEQVTKEITIYWVNVGIYGMHTPFWEQEIRLLSEKVK